MIPIRSLLPALAAALVLAPGALGGANGTIRGRVELRSAIGGSRLVDMLSGEQLPRIC